MIAAMILALAVLAALSFAAGYWLRCHRAALRAWAEPDGLGDLNDDPDPPAANWRQRAELEATRERIDRVDLSSVTQGE